MSPLKRSNNIAARMGRWSASHWKTAVFGWLAFVIAAFYFGNVVGTKNIKTEDAGTGQSHRADQILKQGFPKSDALTELVVVQSSSKTVSDPDFRSTVNDVIASVKGNAAIKNIKSPLDGANPDQISKDRRTAMVTWEMKGKYDHAKTKIDAVEAAVTKAGDRHPGFYVGEAGAVSSSKALDKMFADQLKTAGERSIPITIIVLLLVFGALVAVGVPLLLALSGVLATIGLVALPSHLVPMDQNVNAVILLIGLAVGVDYSLFYLKREREERAAGKGSRAALEAAAATSGRSVLISGFTVMIAMAGMMFSGDKSYLGFGIATMMVVGIAMLGSLTVLPAMLSKLGDRVDKGKIPYLHRLRRGSGQNRFWKKVLAPAMRRPGIAAAVAGGALLVMALPVLNLHTAQSGLNALPNSAPTVGTIKKISAAFGDGTTSQTEVAIKGNLDSSASQHAIAALKTKVEAAHLSTGSIDVEVNPSHTVARVDIPLVGTGTDGKSNAALQQLRNDILPATVGKVSGAEYAVTGLTAMSADQNSLLKQKAPIVFGFVLVFAFVLLLVTFRSIVIAVKAIVLNLLSVGAAYGVLVAVFQWGWGESLLGFQGNGGIASWLPIFMFVILFGLSMDYHVFILSRVREAYDRGLKTEDAVMHGITTTAGVVSSAALVMVGAFAVFALMPILDMKEMGVGLAAAVLIDATIVRAVLLPATMKLLGDANWYLPKWLEWLPRLDHEPQPAAPAPAIEPEPARLAA
ncbi:MAG: MMPL family transporter [Actinobacteria bacterium]|nr:MAG: MMPL family transporter [Actinomycetota bacterium]